MNNSSKTTYEKVAKRCSSYTPSSHDSYSNSCEDCEVSCTTCNHFDAEHYCKLDLYDKIVNQYSI